MPCWVSATLENLSGQLCLLLVILVITWIWIKYLKVLVIQTNILIDMNLSTAHVERKSQNIHSSPTKLYISPFFICLFLMNLTTQVNNSPPDCLFV